jgi:uncharacterized BrkB/YihY/UPF0761 family membrane protein
METDLPRKPRLAQGAFVLAFLAGLQFLLHFCPAAAEEWDGTAEGSLSLPVALCAVLTSAGIFCGFLALHRIVKSKGALKGAAFSVSSIIVCVLLLIWMFSTLAAVSRRTAARPKAMLTTPPNKSLQPTPGSVLSSLSLGC